ncbi:MAG: hypothetical protein HY704_09450 [Gemmatimonadetes bacterium]|nr:hypothetical protein [Gemmatimonadota bacterium]
MHERVLDARLRIAERGPVALLLSALVLTAFPSLLRASQDPGRRDGTGWALPGSLSRERPGTIGIAASGPRAGEAVFRALEAAEKISTGSIHGVATFWAMTRDGKIHRFSNFGRGGTATLFISGEETGVAPPPEIAEARMAGLISTGPREPRIGEPQPERYPTAGDGIGFVVGHRLPSVVGKNGLPVNHEVFLLLKSAVSARAAVDSVMKHNESLDVGLIAVDRNGAVAMHNSALVDRRYDYGHARGEDRRTGAVVETIMNEIHPHLAVAQLVVDVALQVMTGSREPEFQILVKAGTRVALADEYRIVVDGNGVATQITTVVSEHLQGRRTAVIPYILSRVVQNGRVIGYTINEPLTVLESGVIETVSTQREMKVWAKREPRVCRLERPGYTVCDVP